MVSSLIHSFLQFIYPAYCYQCYELIPQEFVFCSRCFSTIKPVVSLQIPITAKKVTKVFAAGAYQEPLQNLVLAKFKRDMLASRQLARIFIAQLPPSIIEDVDVLAPVPLHWMRYAKRGYNQAYVMAREIASRYELDAVPLLKRVKRTRLQASLSKSERKENLHQAFICNERYKTAFIQDKHIALIDDVYTTGATVASAAKALFQAGAREVSVFVGCRKIE